jgi:CIC family chloride channel protein
VAALFVRLGRLAVGEARLLRSAVAGAGLGVAFNSPLGGAMFVFEELWRGYPPRLAACTLLAVVMSHVTAQLMLGNRIDFPVHGLALAPVDTLVPALLIGTAMGLLGVAYNRGLLATMDAFQRARLAPELRAACVGALAGLVAWFLPIAIGGGEGLIKSLLAADAALPAAALLTLLAVRLVLSPLSYAAGTPGGLFAPVLVIGALGGAVGLFALEHVGLAADLPRAGAVLIGMTAFLAATVRAPLTGIALVLEMSASATYLMPMLAACFAAVGTAELLGARPIYDSMIDRIRPGPEEYEARGGAPTAAGADPGHRRA